MSRLAPVRLNLRVLLALLLLCPSLTEFLRSAESPSPSRPKLVVLIVIDGLSEAQTMRYAEQMNGGLGKLLRGGAWYTQARYAHVSTLTSVGHATISTGAQPYVHGIVGNHWKDRKSGAQVYSVEDSRYTRLEGRDSPHDGTSPALLKVETLGDRLRLRTKLQSKVVTVSGKDRAAILLAGHLGTAYFYGERSGRFNSTTYYMEKPPDWWNAYYEGAPQDRWMGRTWDLLLPPDAYSEIERGTDAYHPNVRGTGSVFPHRLAGADNGPAARYYSQLLYTPFADEYTLDFARAAVVGEHLGNNPAGVPDMLAVSLSTHDYMNHEYGPLSRESHDQLLRLDRSLGAFFDFLNQQVGLNQTFIALTADHGFGFNPEYQEKLGLEAGRIDSRKMDTELNRFLAERFGEREYVRGFLNPTIFLDYDAIRASGHDAAAVEAAAAGFIRDYPGIAEVFTRTQLQSGGLPDTPLARRVLLSWDPQVSGDLFVVQRSGWFLLSNSHSSATHGSAWNYDRNVPLVLWGRGVHPGKDPARVHVVDLAATLAFMLDVPLPSACDGTVLPAVLADP